MIHTYESKAVGWEGPQIAVYPTSEQIEAAGRIELVRWYRYLVSPRDSGEVDGINRIIRRMRETYYGS